MANVEVDRFAVPAHVFSRRDVLVRPSPVPSGPGVSGWCFRRWSSTIAADRCCSHQGLALLYARISPDRPSRKGRPPSKQNLAGRIRYHYTGNAEGSTLRKTLGCLLAGGLGIQLRRVGSGSRMTFGARGAGAVACGASTWRGGGPPQESPTWPSLPRCR